MSAITRMITDGSLRLWHDYRAGHAAHLGGYSAGAFDGVEAGALGRFRTGYGFETVHDFAGLGTDASLGYIRVADNAAFFPPADGMCLIASYIQSNADVDCQIIGQGGNRFDNISWQLIRTATQIRFVASDGAATSTVALAIAAVPGQVETVIVRYEGGVAAGNCTVYRYSPTPVTAQIGQIDRVPCNIAQPVSVCCYSNSTAFPFFGTMRYVAFIRGNQDDIDNVTAVADEMENHPWQDAVSACDRSGSVADRAVEYTSRFGADASIADEGTVLNSEISNSGWISGNAAGDVGAWRVTPRHVANVAAGSSADIHKALQCYAAGGISLPITLWSPSTTAASAAYGAWDFWVYNIGNNLSSTYVVYTPNGVNDDGYAIRVGVATTYLSLVSGGVVTDLIAIAANLSDRYTHFRVTRTLNNDWRIFYDVGTGWADGGTATDATIGVSQGMFVDYGVEDALILGNHRAERALFKWLGVVNPL